ncbi:MarR family winged helix-turn-helix transcriptional regulator [Paralcaligenes ureilyticus]|uniref:MarR family transcriptional regulator n=1 Tax=Paralcaligenes ureilyticus TaxID=627131 RepID=A0A4R3LU23_9BURK|nr:MarR family transcriptional regulator [Paralcaligenes ureilyticus]TCT03089.1 MarR family transcriptional regulator [Paralcaligenes ureilyticus]
MSNSALHMQKMEASLDLVARSVAGFPLQDATLAGWLNLAAKGLTNLSDAALSPYDMHQSDFRALMYLFGNTDNPVFPDELSAYLAQTPANVTRITDLLVKRGLVARANCAEDRRRVELRITQAGLQFVLELLPRFFPPLRAAFSCFSAADKCELQRLLRLLVKSMDTVVDS